MYYLCNRKRNKSMTQNNTLKAKVGQFFYAKHRSRYGVWVYDFVSDTAASGNHVADFSTREEARAFVWEMNGWGTPKTALAR